MLQLYYNSGLQKNEVSHIAIAAMFCSYVKQFSMQYGVKMPLRYFFSIVF